MNKPFKELDQVFQKQQEKSITLRDEQAKTRLLRLRQLEKWVLSHRTEIHDALYKDLKKPFEESDITELIPLLSELRVVYKSLRHWSKPKSFRSSLSFLGTTAKLYYEPKGVCLIIAPWNYPFLLTIGPLIMAMAAGNTVFLKPSEFTPSVSSLIAKMIQELYEEDTVCTVEGGVEVSQKLLSFPFNHIFFTGSPQIGKLVMKAAAEHLASVTLELGGKSPTIVDQTANIKQAALKIAWGKYVNAGQTCVAPDYIFVHESIKEAFTRELIKYLRRFTSGQKNYASIISKKHFDRLQQVLVDDQLNSENDIYRGAVEEQTLRMEPQVFADVSFDSTMMREEIFGPILPIHSYKDLEVVIEYINSKEKPLALYHFTNSRELKKSILTKTSSGTVVVNDCVLQFAHPTLPFGGVNNSGFGKSHGKQGFISFSNEKSVLMQRSGRTMVQLLYPPYNSWKNKIMDIFIKYF